MSNWQPIETAPKGGKWVLLWWPHVTDAAFAGYNVGGEWRAATSGDTWKVEGPTHWMPLPEGPTLTKSAESSPQGVQHGLAHREDETGRYSVPGEGESL